MSADGTHRRSARGIRSEYAEDWGNSPLLLRRRRPRRSASAACLPPGPSSAGPTARAWCCTRALRAASPAEGLLRGSARRKKLGLPPVEGTGTALGLVPPDMAVLDGDTDEGRAAIAAMNLPAHFAIRSKTSGGEKHFFRIENPPKRMIRALPGLDVLLNPHSKWIWCKVDNGGDDSGYEIISDTEDRRTFRMRLAMLVEAKSSGAVMRGCGSAAGRTRELAARARWDDDDELLQTEHYLEHGIPYGLQEDRLYRLADRFAAQGLSVAKGTRKRWNRP